ncbi:hypothetical protein SKAU_G00182290 [Synaphobranchus kaupii]|uniref:Uncharacterized protein n=1 Tax=Synaphobranchus kaupii TaxID=118154 RepID=A0A9Q1IWL2_SYNKA|nr:hypothetical protein SKAU_G00182290 [Synaphobranchus kaupii]
MPGIAAMLASGAPSGEMLLVEELPSLGFIEFSLDHTGVSQNDPGASRKDDDITTPATATDNDIRVPGRRHMTRLLSLSLLV